MLCVTFEFKLNYTMQIIVYCNEQPLYLCDEITPEIAEMLKHPEVIFIDELSTPALHTLVHEIRKKQFTRGVIYHPDFKALKNAFFRLFTLIEAAGGIVQNSRKEILFIFRRGKWDLPKGKLEHGENIEECATREIEEETGAEALELHSKIGETYHIYDEHGKHILKTSHWYYFTTDSDKELKPQIEEDITAVKWFATQDIKTPVAATYASIKNILEKFFDRP